MPEIPITEKRMYDGVRCHHFFLVAVVGLTAIGCESSSTGKTDPEIDHKIVTEEGKAEAPELSAKTVPEPQPAPQVEENQPPAQSPEKLTKYLKSKVKGNVCKRFCTLASLTTGGVDKASYKECMKMSSRRQRSPPPPGFCKQQFNELAGELVDPWLNSKEMIDKVLP